MQTKIFVNAAEEPCCTLNIDGADQEKFVKMLKAIGNSHRFEMVKFMLTHPGAITNEVVESFPLAQATVSQHLKILREAGFIIGEIEGVATYYCLDGENIEWFRKKVGDIF